MKHNLVIHPPLLNSSNPWCSTIEQLQDLYDSPYTGAVTTRTSLLDGFPNDSSKHQFAFYNPSTHIASEPNKESTATADDTGSLNTLGYSPLPLQTYLGFVKIISDGIPEPAAHSIEEGGVHRPKPFIISVTGSVDEVVECYQQICALQHKVLMVLAMEVNLSCPNIPGKPPPAYDSDALLSYLAALKIEVRHQFDIEHETSKHGKIHVPIGIKTPPYTYSDQYQQLADALMASANECEPKDLPCPVSFITATNTLGSSLLLTPRLETISSPSTSPSTTEEPKTVSAESQKWREVFHHTLNSASGTGIGGLAGTPLHPLALGNVYTIKGMLFQRRELSHIHIIGVGGVEDAEGFLRMRAVGAAAVGVGTALGRKGVKVFQEISESLKNKGY